MSKIVVITGGGSGLGKSLAQRFVADGDRVVLIGRRQANLEAFAAELGENALPVACDIGDPGAVRDAFARIAERHPRIDVLINCAALIEYSTLAQASDEHIVKTVATNLTGNLLCSRAALAMMERGGHIINVTSVSIDDPVPHHVVYQATKGGVETMSRHLQDEVRPQGIRVSVVRAGAMSGEERSNQADDAANRAFHQACVERGMDLRTIPLTDYASTYWIFRTLVDMPDDIHVDTVRFAGRYP